MNKLQTLNILTQKLHQLEIAGLSDSEEAENIRCAGDSLWYDLTEEEKDRAREFSENLYTEMENK